MSRLLLLSPLVVAGLAYADQVMLQGEVIFYDAPDPLYAPAPGLPISLSVGYGQQSSTIGDSLWHTDLGVYDFANDPNLPGFLAQATNGLEDQVVVTVSDSAGRSYSLVYDENLVFSASWNDQYAAIQPQITGVQLSVDQLVGPGVYAATGGIVAHWDFLGVPEPSMLCTLSLTGLMLLLRRR